MRVTFVGTSNAQPQSDRRQSCLYIEAGGLGHIVDCGDGAPSALYLSKTVKWEFLRTCLITHLHPDHVAAVPVLLHLLYMEAKEKPHLSLCREGMFSWHLPECESSHRLAGILSCLHLVPEEFPFPLDIQFYRAGEMFPAGALTVTPFPTNHCEESHGFILQHGGKRVVVSGDLAKPTEITGVSSGADLLVVECNHFHPRELTASLLKAQPKHTVVTHMHNLLIQQLSSAGPFFNPLWEEGRLSFASDGLTVEVS